MNFDWTTFLLELVNFFILLWILRRFLYRPVLGVIQERRSKIEDQLRAAETIRAEAQKTKEAYEQQLAAWDREKAKARAGLEQEIAAERERLLATVAEEVTEERAKRLAREERERQEWIRMVEQRALALGGRFVAKLLERVASPELENRLIAVALADFPKLPEQEIDKLRTALADDALEVASAFTLAEGQRAALAEALARIAGRPVDPVFKENSALLAGLRVHAGPWVLGANLSDELKFFRDLEVQESTG
jgi:F-type H+-transporting ATPase subunit b